MKNKLTVTALGLALAGGSLSAQLTKSPLAFPDFFWSLTDSMLQANSGTEGQTSSDGLFVPDWNTGDPGTGPDVFSSFTFAYNAADFSNPEFSKQALGGSLDQDTTLTFSLIQPNNKFFYAFGDFDIGFFGVNAGRDNTVRIENPPFPGLELFTFSNNAPTPNPLAWAINLGENGPNPLKFQIWNKHHNTSDDQPQDTIHWRIYKLTASSGAGGEAFGTSPINEINEEDGAVFVLILDDIYPRDQDWDDGFILLSGFVAEVPEPSIIGLAAIVGLGGLIWFRRRKIAKT